MVKNYKHTHALEHFSHEARSRTRSRKSTKKAMTEMPLYDQLSIPYSREELAWGRTTALYNQTSLVVSLPKVWLVWIHSIDVLQSLKVRSEKNG